MTGVFKSINPDCGNTYSKAVLVIITTGMQPYRMSGRRKNRMTKEVKLPVVPDDILTMTLS